MLLSFSVPVPLSEKNYKIFMQKLGFFLLPAPNFTLLLQYVERKEKSSSLPMANSFKTLNFVSCIMWLRFILRGVE